ncbi:hypothetical protein, partial [Streptomyces seoulensis]|uniref:hypothetical protein n=1 Tax=Streptomyces seoulensis TaxID=73044 RepID=UPI0033B8EA82
MPARPEPSAAREELGAAARQLAERVGGPLFTAGQDGYDEARSGMARFTIPATTQANLLFKLNG